MYDEFGNYVGPELDDDSDGGSGEDQDEVRSRNAVVFVSSRVNAEEQIGRRNDDRARGSSFSFQTFPEAISSSAAARSLSE